MKKIQLTRGLFATVDDEDFDELNKFTWYAIRKAHTGFETFYAQTELKGSRKKVSMHRMLVSTHPEVHHKDGNGLNNQRYNLLGVTHTEHQQIISRERVKDSNIFSSTKRGVCFNNARHKWRAQIRRNGKHYFIGDFKTEQEASDAYEAFVIRMEF